MLEAYVTIFGFIYKILCKDSEKIDEVDQGKHNNLLLPLFSF